MHIGFLQKKRWRRIFASFILLCFVNEIFYLPVYALTAGPSSADYGSFEPIDTTDMVSTLTGDFVYNMPLLEVPGPEGGYPLALSYHANISPEQESSWVGLGWTLNPGAVNRHVNGFPDDWWNTETSRRDFWEGGKSETTRVGVTVPIYGYYISAGLTFANDTYKGFGLGADLGAGIGIKDVASVGVDFGVGPYGGFYASAGIGIGYQDHATGFGLGAGLSVSTDFKNGIVAGIGVGVFYQTSLYKNPKQGILGISLSSRGDVSYSVGGLSSSLHNARASAMRSSTTTYTVNLLLASYQNTQTRYWSDEKDSSDIIGALHGDGSIGGLKDTHAGDAYNLQEEDKNLIDHPNVSKHQGGAYPNFDKYVVAAQGLGGSFRPYRSQGFIFTQNQREFNEDRTLRFMSVQYYENGSQTTPYYRFENEFSSYDLQLYPGLTNPDLWDYRNNVSLPFSGSVDHEDGDEDLMTTAPGKHIIDHEYAEVYVNGSPRASFLFPKVNFEVNKTVPPSTRVDNGQITGYSITNTEGVTYHYSLPAYVYAEETYQENRDHKQKLIFNRQTKTMGYAYIWHLTAITGPDYVDRGELNVIDDADYGYWVSFEYGKWSGSHVWRNPAEGMYVDDDGEFSQLSMGRKEVYYLNAIKTRSHTAVFAKSIKKDGKGASPEIFNKNYNVELQASTDYVNSGMFNANSALSMKLDRIYLMNRGDEDIIPIPTSQQNSSPTRSIPCSDCEIISNVYNTGNISSVRQQLENKAIQIIDMEYDYSLVKGTANSFENDIYAVRDGKLTLNAVSIMGRGAVPLAPPTTFEYELDVADRKQVSGILSPGGFTSQNGSLEIGDLLRVEAYAQQPEFAGVIVRKTASGSSYVYSLRNGNYSGASKNTTVVTTKNPTYNKNAVDMWGMYKSDYLASNNETVSRTTTATSGKSVDVWSLRKINTSSGTTMKVAYESDTYNRAVLNSNRSFIITNFTKINDLDYYFDLDIAEGWDLSHFFQATDEIDLVLAFTYRPIMILPTMEFESYSFKPVVQSVDQNLKRVYVRNSTYSIRNFINALPGDAGFKSVLTGNVIVSDQGGLFYGGGTRVSSITTDHMDGVRTTMNYSYHLSNNPQISSGVTVSEPKLYPEDNMKDVLTSFGTSTSEIEAKQKVKNEYKKFLFQQLDPLADLARELPGAGVMYEYVTRSHTITHTLDQVERELPTKTEIHYQVFKSNMVGRQDVEPRQSQAGNGGNFVYGRNLVLKKFVSAIGQVKRMTTYNHVGTKMSETLNHYLHDGLEHLPHDQFFDAYEQRLKQYKKQGVFKERYGETKQISSRGGSGDTDHLYVTMSAKAEYPCVSIGSTTTDYVSQVTSSTKIQEYDFYSGSVIRSISEDSRGNYIEEDITPAYHIFTPMGPIRLWQGRNMLTQVYEKKVSLLDKNEIRKGIISSDVSLWGTSVPAKDKDGNAISQPNIWRPYAQYSWLPSDSDANGLSATVPAFDWYNPANNSLNWKKTNEVTLFNVFSNILESKDINGRYAAQQYGYKATKAVLHGDDGRFEEFTFGSAEDHVIKNGVYYYADNLKGTARSNAMAHTGKYSVLMSPAQKGFIYDVPIEKLDSQKDYIAMVWVRSEGIADINGPRLYYKLDNAPEVLSPSAGKVKYAAGWNLIEMVISKEVLVGKQNLQVGCINTGGYQVYADDFRFSPRDAVMSASVYDLIHGYLTYTLNNNNLYTKYTHDLEGNVMRTYTEMLGKDYIPLLSRNFKNIANFSYQVYTNILTTENILPQGCSTPVTYRVLPGKYISYFSQEDADDQAQEDVRQYGQRYADQHSPCH
ncbi:hypothetical protein FXV77_10660 [Sphingobacterium phlebotomi]|uniref:DUF5977 domain-containing protein n=1 Tax=Sphingobacterium phlebotomi TaxID=2605433 RepID=A0A5D4H8X7_9SPHI|nr:DUF5977 domain-containing protein [Sphingobacterium phlebotomi]TYR36359.1 hypothetical protein FXV77_10660 [Sphingobacterium phlebotomi]